jgi:hypothetical protein
VYLIRIIPANIVLEIEKTADSTELMKTFLQGLLPHLKQE